ncbi:hypothetical protein SDC9_183721 [bioreactor metagenome]|uniref:Uncharacterized protein n=1 Tax=bioreactor metagenome TaxID=1076179 RepID=A0A645HKS3_9ZZZZ
MPSTDEYPSISGFSKPLYPIMVDFILYRESITIRCANCCTFLPFCNESLILFSSDLCRSAFSKFLITSISFACNGIALFCAQKAESLLMGTESSLTLKKSLIFSILSFFSFARRTTSLYFTEAKCRLATTLPR